MNKLNIISFAALALAACSCGSGAPKQAESAAPAAEIVPVVTVETAQKETVVKDAVYSSTVQANVINNIAPQGAGRIQKINVEIGDFVQAGQILAEMDKVQLEQAGLKLKNDENELNRVKSLLAEGGISQSDFDQLELAVKVSRSSYKNLEENTILCSPVSGVITARNYDKGDMYAMAQPIYTVQQITPVKLLVGISETDYTKVHKGDKVSLTADALPGKTFTGTIVRIHPIMDAATHTFNAEVRVANEKRELRPGMFARVTVTFGSDESVVIPDIAVQKQQGSGVRNAFVLNADGTVSLRDIALGRHFDGKYEILSGIEDGEKVVVKGLSSLRNGIKVNVQ